MTRYSIFAEEGENVESRTFATVADAETVLDEAREASGSAMEFLHVGTFCPTHDEWELGRCPHCAELSGK